MFASRKIVVFNQFQGKGYQTDCWKQWFQTNVSKEVCTTKQRIHLLLNASHLYFFFVIAATTYVPGLLIIMLLLTLMEIREHQSPMWGFQCSVYFSWSKCLMFLGEVCFVGLVCMTGLLMLSLKRTFRNIFLIKYIVSKAS